jgi:hypothetical protein
MYVIIGRGGGANWKPLTFGSRLRWWEESGSVHSLMERRWSVKVFQVDMVRRRRDRSELEINVRDMVFMERRRIVLISWRDTDAQRSRWMARSVDSLRESFVTIGIGVRPCGVGADTMPIVVTDNRPPRQQSESDESS